MNFDEENLRSEVLAIKSLVQSNNFQFNSFADFARYVLTKLKESEYRLLHFFISLILVLPFSAADCERSFSAMILIKSDLRNRLREILNALC